MRFKEPFGKQCQAIGVCERAAGNQMTEPVGLGELISSFGAGAGSWYFILDVDSEIGTKQDHPWILYRDFEPRHSFAHGCLRSSSAPARRDRRTIAHPPHDHAGGCLIDKAGWIKTQVARPLEPEWLGRGRFSCVEPDKDLVLEVQLQVSRLTT